MLLDVILILLFILWSIIYIKNKKAIRLLPYLVIAFITPIYNILDRTIFVKIFGCGCVPIAQVNMFNIDFNANDLRIMIYGIISILMLCLGIVISRKFESKKAKVIYNITIIIFNILLSLKISQIYLWN